MSARGSNQPRLAVGYALVSIGFALSVLSVPFGVRLLDEGYILYNSWLLSLGHTPYSEFFVLYPSGMFVFLASVMNIVGPSAIAVRLTVLFCGLLVAISVYILAGRVAEKATALVCAGLTLLWGVPVYNTPFPNWYCLPLLLVAVCVLSRPDGMRKAWRSALVVGLLIGACATIKQSIGVLSIVAFLALTLTSASRGLRGRAAVGYLIGLSVPIGGLGLWMWLGGTLPSFVQAVFIFPLEYRGDIVVTTWPDIPLAGIAALVVLGLTVLLSDSPKLLGFDSLVRSRMLRASVGVAVVAVSTFLVITGGVNRLAEVASGAAWAVILYGSLLVLGAAVLRARRTGVSGHLRIVVLGASGVAGIMFIEAGGALDWSHLFYIVPPMLVVAGWLFGRARCQSADILAAAMAGMLALGGLSVAWLSLGTILSDRPLMLQDSMFGIIVPSDQGRELLRLASVLKSAPEGSSVFVYPVDAGLYFAALRESPTMHSQYVHRLSATEVAEDVERVRDNPPAVIVVRAADPTESIGYTRWAEYGQPVLQESLAGTQRLFETRDFVVYVRPR